MTHLPDARIALLIDADNSPAAKIDVILAELAKFGVANIRRAYGNWKKSELKGWEQVLHEYAIRPIQQFDYSKGKNATDMVMAIDALDLLYTDRPDAFGIVSSDADFTPLVMHLRAKGATVWGFGAKKTPEPFVNACSRFLYLETLGALDGAAAAPAEPARRKGKGGAGAAEEPPAPADAAPKRRSSRKKTPTAAEAATAAEEAPPAALPASTLSLKQDARLVTLLRNAVEGAAAEDGWSPLGAVGKQIGNQASFDPRNYGYKKLGDLIEASQLFEVERRNHHIYVRDRRQARASRG